MRTVAVKRPRDGNNRASTAMMVGELIAAATHIYCLGTGHRHALFAEFPDAAAKISMLRPDQLDIGDPFGGDLATYRKVHLWDREKFFFTPGDLGFPIIETPIGTLGVFICYDNWFSECYRICALQGADIICLPTNWVPIPGQDPDRQAMANIICMASAHTNSVYVAAADRVGEERGQPFIGQSLIVSYTGWPIGGPASRDNEEIIYADCDPAEARAGRGWNERNNILHDRRSDIYDEMLGADVNPGSY